MTKSFKSKISIICVVCLLACMICMIGANAAGTEAEPEAVANYQTVPMYINGIKVADGITVGETTYTPLRPFVEFMSEKTDIAWDEETQTATLTSEELTLSAAAGAKYITANDRCFYLPDGVVSYEGALYVPVRELGKVFGAEISWDEENSCVSICADEPVIIESGEDFYNEEDLYWLSRLINAESGNQPLDGKLAVGNVVINRVADPTCPDTIYGVIFDKRYGVQFSVIEGGIYAEPNDESIAAAKLCLEGYNIVPDSIYFVNPDIGVTSWFARTRVFVASIGEHDFYA